MDPITAIIVGLIISGVSGLFGKTIGVKMFKKKVKAHLDKFFESLEAKINEAHTCTNFKELITKSRALISNRDDFKNQLDNLSNLLNSDIDKLSEFIKGKSTSELERNENEIRFLVAVIYEKWDGKKVEIDVAKIALLAKLGIKED